MDKLAYSVREFAQALGISARLARELVRQHKVPHLRIGRRVLIPAAEAERWLREQARLFGRVQV